MIDKQAILDAFQFRHACKEFDPQRKIDAADFDFILETGRLSPSSFGFEPWRFVIIQNPELRQKLLTVAWGAKKQIPSASHYVAILARKAGMKPDGEHVLHMMRDIQQLPPERVDMKGAVYRKFHESDFDLTQSERVQFEWACRQTYIALGNMMTAAAMIGIDSCPVEGFELAGAEAVLREAGLLTPDQWGLSVMVAFGYRVNPQPAKTRQTLTEITQWVE